MVSLLIQILSTE